MRGRGTTQGEVQSEAGACPRAGVRVQLRARPATSHQHPSSATKCHLKLATLWGPSSTGKGVPLRKLHLLTFRNCSIDLDARELERKRVLGSAGRTEGNVCWDLGG